MINFYENADVKKLLTAYHNPHFNDTQMNIPCRVGVIGSSSSGKTQWLLNFIARSNDTFGHIVVVYKAAEPLYEFLEKKIGAKRITFHKKLSELPQPNDLDHKDKQVLLILDDQVNEKNQEIVKEYFIRGRKCCKGVSIIYISQSFFKIPKIIRSQFNYLILLKLSSARDLQLVVSDFSLGLEKQEVALMYKDATKQRFDFFKVDIDQQIDNKKFSKNFTSFYRVNDQEDD